MFIIKYNVYKISNKSCTMFILVLHTGAISVSRPLDFESCKDYFLTVEATDGGTPPLSAVTMVNINLTDVNDNAPMFSRDAYSMSISEDANIGDTVVKVTVIKINISPIFVSLSSSL